MESDKERVVFTQNRQWFCTKLTYLQWTFCYVTIATVNVIDTTGTESVAYKQLFCKILNEPSVSVLMSFCKLKYADFRKDRMFVKFFIFCCGYSYVLLSFIRTDTYLNNYTYLSVYIFIMVKKIFSLKNVLWN